MKREKTRIVFVLLLVLAMAIALAGCTSRSGDAASDSSETSSTPEPVTNVDVTDTPPELFTPVPVDTTPEPPVDLTPEPSAEPVTVVLQYEGRDVTALSFNTTTVFQLHAVTSNGSSGGTWTSSDASAASVDENGVVTCWKAGAPKITYTIGDASASCTVTITEPTVRIFFAGVEKTDISMSAAWGYEIQLQAVVSPEGSTVTWSSDDTSVASVNENGYVTAHRMGTTNINCKCGTAKATCIFRILDNPPTYMQPTPDPNDGTPRIVITYAGVPNYDFTIRVGEAWDMNYALYNIDPNAAVTWSVSDPAYATVDANGVIVGLKSTFGIAPNRNYTRLIATCGEYTCESIVFIKEKENPNG